MIADAPQDIRQGHGFGENFPGSSVILLSQGGTEASNVYPEGARRLAVGGFSLNAALFQIFESALFHGHLQKKGEKFFGEKMANPPPRVYGARDGRAWIKCARP
jgi:hypothetical protein